MLIQFMFVSRISALVTGRLHWTTTYQPALLFTFWFLFEESKRIFWCQNWIACIDEMSPQEGKKETKSSYFVTDSNKRKILPEDDGNSNRDQKETNNKDIKAIQCTHESTITKQILRMSLVLKRSHCVLSLFFSLTQRIWKCEFYLYSPDVRSCN